MSLGGVFLLRVVTQVCILLCKGKVKVCNLIHVFKVVFHVLLCTWNDCAIPFCNKTVTSTDTNSANKQEPEKLGFTASCH